MNRITQSQANKRAIANAIIMTVAYAITWRFYAMWWFFIAFLDLIVISFYFIVFVKSIVFGFKNRKSDRQPLLPFLINIAAIVLLILVPSIYRNKSYFKSTFELKDCKPQKISPLYIETFCVYGSGALSTDLNSLYLTDSVNFRKHIGTYDEGEECIFTKCKGDFIMVKKLTNANSSPEGNWSKIQDSKTYGFRYLKTSHSWE